MIKNTIDFDYAIEQITKVSKPKIKEQNNILDSESFNTSFEEIEKTLNTLYEKTRYLEDSIQYAKIFLETKTREFYTEMQSVMKELDSLLDMSKNLSYISYNVPLEANVVTINDKDMVSNLSPLIVKDKTLTLGYESYQSYDVSSIAKRCDSISFDNDLQNAGKNKTYKAIYLEEQVVPNGLKETLTFYFPQPVTINVLNFVPTNCNIKNIKFGLINGIEEQAKDYDISMKNVYRTCTYVKMDLICTNYSPVIYEVDKDKITDNIWNDLKEFEMSKISSINKDSKLNTEYIISRTASGSKREAYASSKDKKVVTIKLYSYIFGLKSFEFINAVQQKSGYFISDYINIGQLTDVEHISLYVSQHKDDNTCIEYSILDGEKEIPIIPLEHDFVENEPIYNNIETRFLRIENPNLETYVPDVIKKDGQIVDMTFEDAAGMNDGQYSITYKPSNANNVASPINREVRVKIHIKTYEVNTKDIPYVDMITIRKYGEETLWTNKY